MFSGIIDHCGRIISCDQRGGGCRLWITCDFTEYTLGESIAVDGICLTVVDFEDKAFCVEVSPETRRLTTADNYCQGSIVNLEKALRVGDRLGGHFVTGHVDQLCRVTALTQINEFVEVSIEELQPQNITYLVPKGSITVNGVSLTINRVLERGFQVMLIPHTRTKTNLESLRIDQQVNVECDYLAKCVSNHVVSSLI